MPLANLPKPMKKGSRSVDRKLLQRQANCVGNLMDRMLWDPDSTPNKRTAELLRGVWNLLHVILDDLEVGKECILEKR